jgi:A/G-specific adenine glycosylase
MSTDFTKKLLLWYDTGKRSLPWTAIKDPYKIWLSEIILQQTRVEQGTPYYYRFIKKYPTVFKLAEASLDEVLKLWEGLGYYSRARNLHHAANQIVEKHKGIFPDNYAAVIQLKGIGKYTASAILSYAYALPYAAIDSNAIRIITRYFGIKEEVESLTAKNKIESYAQKILDKKQPGIFNQAMMDFGSLICKPFNPECNQCPLNKNCFAFKNDMVELLPLKGKKLVRKTRYFNYLVFISDKNILITIRNEKDIWKNLYQFPLIEAKTNYTLTQLKREIRNRKITSQNLDKIRASDVFTQQLTHQTIKTRFFIIEMSDIADINPESSIKIKVSALKKYAFPGIIREFLQKNPYF